MSMKPRTLDFDEVWSSLQDAVHKLMTGNIRRSDWYDSYNDVYHLCVATPESLAKKLYDATKRYLQDHVANLHEEVRRVRDDPIGYLAAYSKQWHEYSSGCQHLDTLYFYLNIEHVKKKQTDDAGAYFQWFHDAEQQRLEIGQLGLEIWLKTMIEPEKFDLIPRILEAIRAERNGNGNNAALKYVKDIVDSFVATESHRVAAPTFYKQEFEKAYLEDTREYYEKKSETLIMDRSIPPGQVFKQLLEYLENETIRSAAYLDKSSCGPVLATCRAVLVEARLQYFLEQAETMWDSNISDLRNVYKLLKPLDPSAMEPLITQFSTRVRERGAKLFANISPDSPLEAENFVEAFFTVCTEYQQLVLVVFDKDQQFVTALERCSISMLQSFRDDSRKAPDLLAKYCDQHLKSGKAGTNLEESAAERKLLNTIHILKFLPDKDYFAKVFLKLSARRLLSKHRRSIDLENTMVKLFDQACAPDHTVKLTHMIADIPASQELTRKFRSEYGMPEQDFNPEFSAFILQAKHWPMSRQLATNFIVPPQLKKVLESFEKFYHQQQHQQQQQAQGQSKKPDRILTWLHQNETLEVQLNYCEQAYTVFGNTFTLSVLMLFENVDTLTRSEIEAQTDLETELLNRILSCLAHRKLLLLQRPRKSPEAASGSSQDDRDATPNFEATATFTLNLKFASSRPTISVFLAPSTARIEKERQEAEKQAEQDRSDYLEALIARTMKNNGVLKATQLLYLVQTEALKHYLILQPEEKISKVIDKMLRQDNGVIEISSDDPLEYSYKNPK